MAPVFLRQWRHAAALVVAQPAADRTNEGRLLDSTGCTLARLGRYSDALENHQQVIAMMRDAATPVGRPTC